MCSAGDIPETSRFLVGTAVAIVASSEVVKLESTEDTCTSGFSGTCNIGLNR